MPETSRQAYLDGPTLGELVAVVAAGALHVVAELLLSESIALTSSAAAVAGYLTYVVWRARVTPGALTLWGLRRDNFLPALRAQLAFVAVAGVALAVIGAILGRVAVPRSFWLTLALYPLWGTAQQFALQNLIARNLLGFTRNEIAIACIASALFGLSHYPRIDLALLTLAAGVPFTLIFRRRPNLWAVGIAHGILGTLAVYWVAGEDPGALILGSLTGP